MLEFGSQVMLKVMDKVSGGVMQERWVEGTWLGSRFATLGDQQFFFINIRAQSGHREAIEAKKN